MDQAAMKSFRRLRFGTQTLFLVSRGLATIWACGLGLAPNDGVGWGGGGEKVILLLS